MHQGDSAIAAAKGRLLSATKVVLDRIAALLALAILWPLIAIVALATWVYDFKNPIYVSLRVGRDGKLFRLYKIRTMGIGADSIGPMTTAADDPRVTPLGAIIRRGKIDELPQFFNVLVGDMSLVGPRPQVLGEVDTYTLEERNLLSVRPGLSDYSSIVFSDLGEIVRAQRDPHLAYQQLVRPWKSRLGIFYIENPSLMVDMGILIATAAAIVSHRAGVRMVVQILKAQRAPADLVRVAQRECQLMPAPPPGSDHIVGT